MAGAMRSPKNVARCVPDTDLTPIKPFGRIYSWQKKIFWIKELQYLPIAAGKALIPPKG